MNYIWVFMILISYVFSFFTGNTDTVTKSVFDGCESAVSLVISLLGMMCLWTGLLEIAKDSGLTNKIHKFLYPVIRLIFPNVCRNPEIAGAKAVAEFGMKKVEVIVKGLGAGR